MMAALAIVCLVGLFIIQGALCFVAGVLYGIRANREDQTPPA